MLPSNNKLKPPAQSLRKNATKEERHLWYDFLKTYPVQFNRQKVIGNFIVDFYCDKAKLVIELDGAQHYEENAQLYDEERTAYLCGLGITVVRFSMKKPNPTRKITIPEDGLLLAPNKLYLGRTNEYTKTDKYVPMLEGRSSTGRLGLFIHVTAGFGDVGFAGYWTLEIFCV